MPTAAQIANAAYRQEEDARRRRQATAERQREAAARRARTRAENAARSRLSRSLISEWFPGVEWVYIETEDNKDIWEDAEGDIKMAVLHNVTDSAHKLRLEFVQIKDWMRRGTGYYPHRKAWRTVPVNTVAEVGRAKDNWDRACTPPDYLP